MRPVVIVSHRRYAVIPGLFLAVPLTTVDRRLPHHVEVPADETTQLVRTSYAMTERIRALSRQRIERQIGSTSDSTLAEISRYVHMFIA
jgi:mRNA interferase MazF